MISIVSGPSCVGKSYFLKNKRERLLEIESIEYHHTEVVNWVEFPLGNILDNTWEDGRKEGKWLDYLLLKVNPVSAIILGVPYSEYKVRIELRRERKPSRRRARLLQILNVYREWIDVLNKNEIPYVFVEAIGDYKVLEEEEFFRMLND